MYRRGLSANTRSHLYMTSQISHFSYT